MKPSIYRRVHRRSANKEAASFKKDNQQEQSFFGETMQEPFFKPVTAMPQSATIQRKCEGCEQEEKKLQKKSDGTEKKEEEKKLQKKSDGMEKKEEDKKLQKKSDGMEKKEEDKKLQKKSDGMEKKEEDKKMQKKETGSSNAAGTSVSSYVNGLSSTGQSMPAQANNFFSSRIGYDFSNVKIHTGKEAADSAKAVHAKAYTVGNHIVFNEGAYRPETQEGKQLLAHELAHVAQQGASKKTKSTVADNIPGSHNTAPAIHRLPLLNAAAEKEAIAHNRKLFDKKSVMIIQLITGANVDGGMGPATVESIAGFQTTNGLAANGKVDDATLNAMFTDRVTGGRHEHAIQLVVDFNNFDRADVLSFHFDPAILFSATSFQPGGLRVITLGPLAFLSPGILKLFIELELLKAPPAVPALGPKPTHLSAAQEAGASSFNRIKYNDSRSVRGIQGIIGATPDGKFGGDSAERIAEFQSSNGITIDGKAGEETLRVIVPQLAAANQHDTAIRLIMDFYNMNEFGALIEIFFDPTLTGANAETPSKDIPGPDIVKVGPSAFTQGYAGLVHTIAHELEHVRQNKLGIADLPLSEFLGESIEIISKGMPDEDVAGFFNDAGRAMNNWDRMQVADQKSNWNKFVAVRNAVRRRFAAATAAEQATHNALMIRYNAAAKPA